MTRTGWSGEVGYEIYLCDGSQGDKLWELIMEAGRPYEIRPTGPSDIRRIEAGIFNYGVDMTLDNNPYEVGLGWLVDLDQQADFIGKEALKRIKAEGADKKLVGIELEGTPINFNMSKWPVSHGGERVGQVTSAIYSPRLKKNIAYANVPVEIASIGTKLVVTLPDASSRPAKIVPKPFVDPKKEIPKS